VVVTATVRTATHGNNPPGVRHLIVDLSQSRSHLVRESSGNDHDIRLSRRSTENDTETILIVAGGRQVHHLDGAACKTERHGPERALTGPVGYLIERCPVRKIREDGLASIPDPELLTSPTTTSTTRAASREAPLRGIRWVHVQCVLHNALLALLAGQWHLAPLLAGNAQQRSLRPVPSHIMRRHGIRRLRGRRRNRSN